MRPWRFNELKKSLEGISQKVLTDSLRSMEDDGLITRTVYNLFLSSNSIFMIFAQVRYQNCCSA